ncbi:MULTISPECIES: hypothetical protein [unclassified Streptomyces]|uniref:hypothetical protein n=1 Tax=unclassified Streptomyces TaxID=2593676 RepID=UPI0033207DA3
MTAVRGRWRGTRPALPRYGRPAGAERQQQGETLLGQQPAGQSRTGGAEFDDLGYGAQGLA